MQLPYGYNPLPPEKTLDLTLLTSRRKDLEQPEDPRIRLGRIAARVDARSEAAEYVDAMNVPTDNLHCYPGEIMVLDIRTENTEEAQDAN